MLKTSVYHIDAVIKALYLMHSNLYCVVLILHLEGQVLNPSSWKPQSYTSSWKPQSYKHFSHLTHLINHWPLSEYTSYGCQLTATLSFNPEINYKTTDFSQRMFLSIQRATSMFSDVVSSGYMVVLWVNTFKFSTTKPLTNSK